jgi:hypothetical protein
MTSIEKHRPSVLSVKKMFANETLERRPVRRSFSQVERPRHRGADHGPTLANQTQHGWLHSIIILDRFWFNWAIEREPFVNFKTH